MPIVSSYADIIRDWESVLVALIDNLGDFPEIQRYATALQAHLDETKILKARQDAANAARQRATQELRDRLIEGRALAIRLRGSIKAALGHTHEGLVQYGVAPFRRRVRRTKPVEPPPVTELTALPVPSATPVNDDDEPTN
jgi:hypothetical protein